MRRLEIGPGGKREWDTLDVMPEYGNPYIAQWGTTPLPVPDASYDEVVTGHTLEHIPWYHTQLALKEIFRILTPGGRFEVWVPNMEFLVDCYLKGVRGDRWRRHGCNRKPFLWFVARIFAYSLTPNGEHPELWHHAAFDPKYLKECLEEAGFVNVKRMMTKEPAWSRHGPHNMGMEGYKPQAEAQVAEGQA